MSGGLRFDLAKIARWAVPVTMATIAMDVAMLAMGATRIYRAFWAETNALESDSLNASLAIMLRNQQIAGTAFFVVAVCAYVINGIWIYRASWNARQLLPFKERIRPGWAIGWFFVPILMFWKPYIAMKETWAASHRVENVPGWMSCWWAAWVVVNILQQGTPFLLGAVEYFDPYRILAAINALSSLISLVAGFLFLKIIREVSRAQAGRRPEEVFE